MNIDPGLSMMKQNVKFAAAVSLPKPSAGLLPDLPDAAAAGRQITLAAPNRTDDRSDYRAPALHELLGDTLIFAPPAPADTAKQKYALNGAGPDLADMGGLATLWQAAMLMPDDQATSGELGSMASLLGSNFNLTSAFSGRATSTTQDQIQALGTDIDTWGILADWLIVSRPQDKMVETSDGALHMAINKGLAQGLTIVTSTDDGRNWDVSLEVPSNLLGTADIRLLPGTDTMMMSYVNAANNVAFAVFVYDDVSNGWTPVRSAIVDPGSQSVFSVQPTVAISNNGIVQIAYTEEVEGGVRLVLAQSSDAGVTWTLQEMLHEGSSSGAARMIVTDNGRGIVFATHDAMYWVTFNERDSWTMEVIDENGTVGRFASHFNTTKVGDDIYLVNVGTDLNMRLIRYDGATGTWDDPSLPLGLTGDVTSVQISASDTGNLYITYDDYAQLGRLIVLASSDGGHSWTEIAVLQTPQLMVAGPTRFEAPEQFSGDLVIAQQVKLPNSDLANGLYYHTVDQDVIDSFVFAEDFIA